MGRILDVLPFIIGAVIVPAAAKNDTPWKRSSDPRGQTRAFADRVLHKGYPLERRPDLASARWASAHSVLLLHPSIGGCGPLQSREGDIRDRNLGAASTNGATKLIASAIRQRDQCTTAINRCRSRNAKSAQTDRAVVRKLEERIAALEAAPEEAVEAFTGPRAVAACVCTTSMPMMHSGD
jgi:hypothetical protein